jgi:hypothetical protein
MALPNSNDFRQRTQEAFKRALAQEERRRWRVLLLRVKARLEEIAEGVSFEEAFMPFVVLPDGRTVREYVLPEVKRAYEMGVMPKMLPWSE